MKTLPMKAFIAVAAFGLAGCPGSFAQQKLQSDIDGLKREVREIKAGRKTAGDEDPQLRTRLADLGASLDQIRTELSLMQGRLESLQEVSSKRSDELLRVRQDLEIRIAQLDEQVRALQERISRLSSAAPESPDDGSRTASPLPTLTPKPGMRPPEPHPAPPGLTLSTASPTPAPEERTDKSTYQNGIEALDGKRYGEARTTFLELITRYPKSEYADNARYWIAESYYAEKDYPSSILEFDKVVRDYPNGDKVPAALLKQGFAFLEIGEKEGGVATLQDLVRRYPRSDEAKKAKERLAKLN